MVLKIYWRETKLRFLQYKMVYSSQIQHTLGLPTSERDIWNSYNLQLNGPKSCHDSHTLCLDYTTSGLVVIWDLLR